MGAYYANSLREVAKVIDIYEEQELELIKLAGFNLDTLINKLKAGYTIEAPKEKDWAQGMTEVYVLNVDCGWDDLTDYEKRKLYESQQYLLNKKRR